jgi:hypothetical protein
LTRSSQRNHGSFVQPIIELIVHVVCTLSQ